MKSERGITIIETTVILSVLFILAGAMSPIVSESVTTARAVRAKSDAQMIAMALINLQKDLGGDALAFTGLAGASAEQLNLPAVLATSGNLPDIDGGDEEEAGLGALVTRGAADGNGGNRNGDRVQRRELRRQWREAPSEDVQDYFVTNRRGFRYRQPGEYGGWNGPYLSSRIKSDPWGKRYQVNTRFLDGRATAVDGNGRPRRAVFVVSSGSNGVVETPFEQPITDAAPGGDDIVIRIQ